VTEFLGGEKGLKRLRFNRELETDDETQAGDEIQAAGR
jgi:hypothetical protein